MVAQNLDIPTFYHGFQTLLHIKDPAQDMETFLFTFPGFIAANGINSHSVAVVVNAVQQLENSRDGCLSPLSFEGYCSANPMLRLFDLYIPSSLGPRRII